MRTFLWGALAALSWVAALFMLRFWKVSRDRFFLLFSLGFWIFGANWVVLTFVSPLPVHEHYTYVIRLVAFALIIAAIIDKNRQSRDSSP